MNSSVSLRLLALALSLVVSGHAAHAGAFDKAAEWIIRKAIEKAGVKALPREGKLHDGTLEGPTHKRFERERTRQFEAAERRARTG